MIAFPIAKVDEGWGRILAWVLRIALMAFPAASLLIDDYASAALVLGLIGAVFFLGKDDWKIDRSHKLLALAFSSLFIWSLIQWPFADAPLSEMAGLDNTPRFLLFLPLLLLFRKLNLGERAFMHSVVWGTIAVGLFAILFYALAKKEVEGCHNTIIFGNLALLLGGLSLLGVERFKGHAFMVALSVVAAVMGLAASFLSGARGGWVAGPFFLVVAFNYILSPSSLGRRIAICILSIVVLVAAGASVKVVRERVSLAVSRYDGYLAGEKPGSSVGMRFGMWQQVIGEFSEHPVLGHGPGTFRYETEFTDERGRTFQMEFNHPHNVFLSYLWSGGIVGLLFLLAFYIYPAAFWKRGQRGAFSSACVWVVLLGYGIFGLTEDIFARNAFITFYVMVSAWIISTEEPSCAMERQGEG